MLNLFVLHKGQYILVLENAVNSTTINIPVQANAIILSNWVDPEDTHPNIEPHKLSFISICEVVGDYRSELEVAGQYSMGVLVKGANRGTRQWIKDRLAEQSTFDEGFDVGFDDE